MYAEERGHNDIATLIRDHIRLQRARQRLAFALFKEMIRIWIIQIMMSQHELQIIYMIQINMVQATEVVAEEEVIEEITHEEEEDF